MLLPYMHIFLRFRFLWRCSSRSYYALCSSFSSLQCSIVFIHCMELMSASSLIIVLLLYASNTFFFYFLFFIINICVCGWLLDFMTIYVHYTVYTQSNSISFYSFRRLQSLTACLCLSLFLNSLLCPLRLGQNHKSNQRKNSICLSSWLWVSCDFVYFFRVIPSFSFFSLSQKFNLLTRTRILLLAVVE